MLRIQSIPVEALPNRKFAALARIDRLELVSQLVLVIEDLLNSSHSGG